MTKIFIRKQKIIPMTVDNSRVEPMTVDDKHIIPMMAEEGEWVELDDNLIDLIEKKENE
jgi:hypothetical protein